MAQDKVARRKWKKKKHQLQESESRLPSLCCQCSGPLHYNHLTTNIALTVLSTAHVVLNAPLTSNNKSLQKLSYSSVSSSSAIFKLAWEGLQHTQFCFWIVSTSGSHPACTIRMSFGGNWKLFSVSKEPVLSGFSCSKCFYNCSELSRNSLGMVVWLHIHYCYSSV